MRTLVATILAPTILVLAVVVSCAPREENTDTAAAEAPMAEVLASGTVTEIGGHGNAYTDLRNSALDSAGVTAGDHIVLAFGDTEIEFTVGNAYDDVSNGQNVAVLHREGTVVLAVYNGDFFRLYGIPAGTQFEVRRAEP